MELTRGGPRGKLQAEFLGAPTQEEEQVENPAARVLRSGVGEHREGSAEVANGPDIQ